MSERVCASGGEKAPAKRPTAKPGRAWTKAGRYWIAYSTVTPPVILGVFYEAADIPNRDT